MTMEEKEALPAVPPYPFRLAGEIGIAPYGTGLVEGACCEHFRDEESTGLQDVLPRTASIALRKGAVAEEACHAGYAPEVWR